MMRVCGPFAEPSQLASQHTAMGKRDLMLKFHLVNKSARKHQWHPGQHSSPFFIRSATLVSDSEDPKHLLGPIQRFICTVSDQLGCEPRQIQFCTRWLDAEPGEGDSRCGFEEVSFKWSQFTSPVLTACRIHSASVCH